MRSLAWSLAGAAVAVALGMSTAAEGQTGQKPLDPLAGHGQDGVYGALAKAKWGPLVSALYQDYAKCDRAAFDRDLQSLADLAKTLQQMEQNARLSEEKTLRAAGGTDKSVNASLDRQRDRADTDFGQAYNDSVAVNRSVAQFRAYNWARCNPPAAVKPVVGGAAVGGKPTNSTAGGTALAGFSDGSSSTATTPAPKPTYVPPSPPVEIKPSYTAGTQTPGYTTPTGAKTTILALPVKPAPSAPPKTCPKGQKLVVIAGKSVCSGATALTSAQ